MIHAGRRWILSLALLVPLPARAQADDARELMKRVLDSVPKVPFAAKLRLTTPEGVRELELSHKLVGGARSSYLEVTAPDTLKGMRFLFLEHLDKPPQQYIKIPASKRHVLVTEEASKQPFLASAFYVADLIEPELDASTYRFAGEQTVINRPCKLVESVPKNPDDAIYGKTINALDPSDLLVLKREFFDHKQRPLKVWEVRKVEKVDGHWTILDQTMTNVQERTTSRLEAVSVHFQVELPDSMFTPDYLLR